MTELGNSSEQILKLVEPVWMNAEKVKTALGIYEGIGQYAKEINKKKHGHFFGYCQQHALDSSVLGICRMYDTTKEYEKRKGYEKLTIPELAGYLMENLEKANPRNINNKLLGRLNVADLATLLAQINMKPLSKEVADKILKTMPMVESDDSLKKIFTYRNKVAAHQERLDDDLAQQLRALPSLEEMERINNWAKGFCEFFVDAFTGNVALVDSVICGRMSALNVIKKVLDKNFDDPSKTAQENYEAMEKFYKQGP